MSSKAIMTKMYEWLEDNPYVFYAAYDDKLPQKHVDLIVDGEMEAFREAWWEITIDMQSYADTSHIEASFASEFELNSSRDDWPETIQGIYEDGLQYDTSGYLRTCLSNTRTRIAAKPVKQSGENILFPHWHNSQAHNRYLNRYNKKYLGIESSHEAEVYYSFDALTVIGSIDLAQWLEQGRKPDFVRFGPDDFILSHNFFNGSGGVGDIIVTKERKMRAEFRNDETDSYGVQAVFGLVGECWENKIHCIWQ